MLVKSKTAMYIILDVRPLAQFIGCNQTQCHEQQGVTLRGLCPHSCSFLSPHYRTFNALLPIQGTFASPLRKNLLVLSS